METGVKMRHQGMVRAERQYSISIVQGLGVAFQDLRFAIWGSGSLVLGLRFVLGVRSL